MSTKTLSSSSGSTSLIQHIAKLIAGPLAYFIVANLPLAGLEGNAQPVLAIYVWLVIWWCLQPVPWAATCMLPLLLLPTIGGMKLAQAASAIFGQRILFLLVFVFLLGEPIKRYGLGRRIAMNLLSIKWINGSVNRFVLIYMLSAALLQALFGIAGTIVIAPVGVATLDYIFKEYEANGIEHSKIKLGAYVTLGGCYGALAGGFCTLQAIPHNVMVLSIMEELLGMTTTYVQWITVGVPLGLAFIAVSYMILRLLYGKSAGQIPGGVNYFQTQRKEMGPITRQEMILTITSLVVIVLWAMTTFVSIPGIDFYWVSYFGILIMFLVPADFSKNEGLFTVQDLKSINWNIILLVTAAVGYSGLLESVGIVAWVSNMLQGINGIMLLLIAAFVTPVLTNFLPGMATAVTMATILLPLCNAAGINPAVVARIIPTMSMGFIFPWAGTLSAIFFGTNKLDIKEMAKTGIIISALLGVLAVLGAVALVPLFHSYTPVG